MPIDPVIAASSAPVHTNPSLDIQEVAQMAQDVWPEVANRPLGSLADTRESGGGTEKIIISPEEQHDKGITNTQLVEDVYFENHDNNGKQVGDCTLPPEIQAARQKYINAGDVKGLENLDGFILNGGRSDKADIRTAHDLGLSLEDYQKLESTPHYSLFDTRTDGAGNEKYIMSAQEQHDKNLSSTNVVEDIYFENHDNNGRKAGDCTLPPDVKAARDKAAAAGPEALEKFDSWILTRARDDQGFLNTAKILGDLAKNQSGLIENLQDLSAL